MRFDIKVLSCLLLVPFTVSFIALAFPRTGRFFLAIFVAYLILQSLFLFFLLFIDQFYYGYFQNHIDVRIFGFIEDDTKALLRTFWEEYPVLLFLISLLLLFAFATWLIWKLRTYLIKLKLPAYLQKTAAQVLFVFFALFFLALSARGSLSTFPLRRMDSNVSQNEFLNF